MEKIVSTPTKDRIIKYLSEFNTKMKTEDKDLYVVSLKILFPKDSSLNSLFSLLFLHEGIVQNSYVEFENMFVHCKKDAAHDEKIERTLTFLDNKKGTNYRCNTKKTTILKKKHKYNLFEDKPITIVDKIRKKFCNEALAKTYWDQWNDCIKEHFPYGQSSLWSSISLNYNKDVIDIQKEKEPKFIVSAYFIFSKPITDIDTQIYIDKSAHEILNYLILEQYKKEINANSVRAALAQVMARNMSHNIGSHVFANLIESNVYENLSQKIDKNTYSPKVSNSDPNKQLAFFNQYLKSRMDYLSEVTFGVSNILTTKKMYSELFLEFDRVRLLLNYISGIEKFNFEFNLKYTNFSNIPQCIDDRNDNISAAFPSDVLGCQAFYNIIENIIRNTAKHAKNTIDGIKTFTIHIKDIRETSNLIKDNQQYYCVEIDDGIAINGSEKRTSKNEKFIKFIDKEKSKFIKRGKYYRSKGSIENINWLVDNLNYRLNDSVLDENYKLRSHSLGLLEMEASAAFLRQIDISEIEAERYAVEANDLWVNSNNEFNILKAFKTDNNALGYRFFIKKPQEFLFVGDWDITDGIKNKLMNQGVWFKSEDDLNISLKEGMAFAHRFIISTKSEDEFFANKSNEQKLQDKTLLPNKWVCIKDNFDEIEDLLNHVKSDNAELSTEFDILRLEAKVWEIYYNRKKVEISQYTIKTSVPDNFKGNKIILLDHLTCQEDKYRNFAKNKLINTWIEPLSTQAQSKLPFFHLNIIL